MNEKNSCADCKNSYQGSDNALRCRVHSRGIKCSPALAEGCAKFEREAGADGVESSRVWNCGRGN